MLLGIPTSVLGVWEAPCWGSTSMIEDIQKAKNKYYGKHNMLPRILRISPVAFNELNIEIKGMKMGVKNLAERYGGFEIIIDADVKTFELEGGVNIWGED